MSTRATYLTIEAEDDNMLDWSLVTIILVVIGMGITIMGFQWRQNVAMERRLREDNRTLERRLREDNRTLERRLREDNRTLETRMREDDQELEARLREDNRTLERRLETIDADVKTLICEVGLIKGALLGVSDEISRSLSERESAPTP